MISLLGTSIINSFNKGWLCQKEFCLPYMSRVNVLDRDGKTEHITILEGVHEGQHHEIKYPNLKSKSLFESKLKHSDYAELSLSLSKKLLYLKLSNPLKLSVEVNDVKVGDYIVKIPASPVDNIPEIYQNEGKVGTRFAGTWFQFINDNKASIYSTNQYIHFGKVSKGCITVLTSESWNKLYFSLISSRLDTKSIGLLKVVA